MKNFFISAAFLISTLANAQLQTDYHSNGKKKSEGAFVASTSTSSKVVMASDGSSRPDPSQEKIGKWSYWYDSGKMSAEEYYTAGTTSGIWKTWYPNGVQSSEINYTNQTAVFYHQNGKKQSEGGMLANRVFNGQWTAWHENGQKIYTGTYLNGKKEGVWNWFDANGKQTTKDTYANDVLIDSQKF
jgi:antitoxin component YwqK of YwqJK toxin-antitoxin module